MNHQVSSRRHLLKRTGQLSAGIVLAVSGGVVYRAFQEDIFSPIDGPAFQPWQDWQQLQSGSIGLAQVAILAANPHNTQPWRFDIQAQQIDIYADLERNLGSFDPYRREMYLGLGCAIENLCLAAEHQGMNTNVRYTAGTLNNNPALSGTELVASIALSPISAKTSGIDNPLYAAIPHRHTNRFPYSSQPVSSALLEAIQQEADNHGITLNLFFDGEKRQAFNQLMIDSTQWIINDEVMVHDSHRWFRNNKGEVNKHRDGPFMDGVGLPKTIAAVAKLLPPTPAQKAHELWLNSTRDNHLPNTPVVGVIAVANRYDKVATLTAGRFWQRLHLMATHEGVDCHPMNQPVEWIDRLAQLEQTNVAEQRMQSLLDNKTTQATFSFRMGYATTKAVTSPRRALTDRLV